MATLSKRQLRSAVSALRRAAVTGDWVWLEGMDRSVTVQVRDVVEHGRFELSHRRIVVLSPPEMYFASHLRFMNGSVVLCVPVTLVEASSDGLKVSFDPEAIEILERRKVERTRPTTPVWALMRIESVGVAHLSACLTDENATHARLRLRISTSAPPAAVEGATVSFMDRRTIVPTERGGCITAVRLVDASQIDVVVRWDEGEAVKPDHLWRLESPTVCEIVPVESTGTLIQVRIDAIGTSHASGLVAEASGPMLDYETLCRLEPSGLLVSAKEDAGRCTIRLLDDGIGTRLQFWNTIERQFRWSGFMDQSAASKAIGQILVEGVRGDIVASRLRGTSSSDSGRMLLRGPAAWRTVDRVIARNRDGRILGHGAMQRVSERLWAAVDNIGSGDFEGRWNRDRIAPWLRRMARFFEHDSAVGILWLYADGAGVWDDFGTRVNNNPNLAWVATRLAAVFPQAVTHVRSDQPKLTFVDRDARSAWVARLNLASKAVLDFVIAGVDDLRSTIQLDMMHDYGLSFRKETWLLTLPSGAEALMVVNNYPSWSSLQSGHDPYWLLPLTGCPNAVASDAAAVIDAAIELSHRMRVSVPRVFALGLDGVFDSWAGMTLFVLKPAALAIAAEYADLT